ncbi:hypothetical protein [Leifsonia sp. NPDC077715]|uniref:hypothetical protein n=1 Tax=Leifsonia sp. NPDC077715 TaxID=3155539 RepID=UPI0034352CA9
MSAATEAAAAATTGARASRGSAAARTKKAKAQPTPKPTAVDIRIGAEPRVDLLPAEIRTARKHEQIVRRMIVGLIGAVAVVAVAVIGANALAFSAGFSLGLEQARGTQILQAQGKYNSLRATQSELALVKAAQAVGGATEIDWNTRGTDLIGALPPGAAITNVTIDSATPVTLYQQSTVPGATPRVASATVTITAPSLPVVSQWLDTIGSLPDVVETDAGAVTLQSEGSYKAIATIRYGVSAWDGKYLPKSGSK